MPPVNFKSFIQNLYKSLLTLERFLLVLFLFSMLAIAIAQIVLRNFFGTGFIWGDAAVRLLVLWTALLGAMQAAHFNEHIRVDALLRLFNKQQRYRVDQLSHLISASICVLASWVSADFVIQEYHYGAVAFGNLPSWLCAIIIPVAFVMMALRFLLATFDQSKTNMTLQREKQC